MWAGQFQGRDSMTIKNSVSYRIGTIRSNKIAAFDVMNTLIQSDTGLPNIRFANKWVSTSNKEKIIKAFTELVNDNWTIVVFSSDIDPDPNNQDLYLGEISEFFRILASLGVAVDPFVYLSYYNDENSKPEWGMWKMFLADSKLEPSQASFYCGDSMGPQSPNPLYQMDDTDFLFARNCGLAFYTPDDILGVFIPEVDVSQARVLLVMSTHMSQFQDFVDDLIKNHGFKPTVTQFIRRELAEGNRVIVGSNWGRHHNDRAARRTSANNIPKEYHDNTKVILFTRQIKPFISAKQFKVDEIGIRATEYIRDIYPRFDSIIPKTLRDEPFDIIRIN